ncbi:MAG: hypothetical protein ACLR7U_11110 [Ruthenibacterium lactatiformans]
METEVKTRRKIQLRMPGRRTATGKNVNWILMKRNKVLYLFILPAFLYFLIFAYVPMYGVQIAFKDFVANKGFLGSEWADPLFKHFITFFSSVNFWEILRNTIGLSLYYLAISFPMPILLALMINEVKNTRFKKAVQNITYMPYFVSTVVLVGMINLFFSYNGLANNIGALFGAEPQMFLMKDALFNGCMFRRRVAATVTARSSTSPRWRAFRRTCTRRPPSTALHGCSVSSTSICRPLCPPSSSC